MIARGYLNTMFVLVMSLILQITLTSLGAYFLSRRNVMFQKPIMLLITFTMFFSGGMIPTYLNMKSLHLTGSLWGLILPFMISVYNLIILKTSFASIPESLIEAARIDGASHLKVLFSIVLPLSKAILAVMVLYYGVGVWNGWFWASAILRDREMYPPAARPARDLTAEQHLQHDGRHQRWRCGICGRHCQVCHHHGRNSADPLHLSVPAEILCRRRHGRRSQGVKEKKYVRTFHCTAG